MKQLMPLALIIISGCTISARDTPTVISDEARYNSYNCQILYDEANNLARFGTELSRSIDKRRADDMAFIATLGIFSLPLANIKQTIPASEQLSIVKGDMGLIEKVSLQSDCGIEFQSNEAVPYSVDNSTNPILGLKPIDRSVVYKVVKSSQ